ncbi:MAG: AIR synthase related protein, partial [Mycobacteriales bacterium]
MQPAAPDFDSWTCPVPLRDSPTVLMGHGGGGQLSAELIDHLFVPAFGNQPGAGNGDSAVFELGGVRIAFSTDTFVVQPLFFPGGSIGDLAVNGTVNDLAMSGAVPSHLSCGFVLEEGTDLSVIGRIAADMGAAATAAEVAIVTGDTKVVDAGHGDQVYVNTAGVGLVPAGVDIRPPRAETGDVVIVSGPIGVHGIAIMSVREGLQFGSEIVTDSAALHPLVA